MQQRWNRLGFSRALSCTYALAALACATCAQAQYSGRRAEAALEISECVVYSDRDEKIRHDCTAKARELCNGKGRSCELPIGLVLSAGRDIDGDPKSWEKVRVRYTCGGQQRINGPHHQNDHASMILSCAG